MNSRIPSKRIAIWLVICTAGFFAYRFVNRAPDFPAPANPTGIDTALLELRQGNHRFSNSCRILSTDTSHDASHRHATAKRQRPFVAILCCSDSRVCPEIIFDQRCGSIFEIRNAGNVVDEIVLASFEYAVEHLHVPLIVILGHKGCGAVEAVCEAGDKPMHDHLRLLQTHMQGLGPQIIACNHPHDADSIDRLSQENARQQADCALRESPILRSAMDRNQTRVIYGIYDMETGLVDFFDLDTRH